VKHVYELLTGKLLTNSTLQSQEDLRKFALYEEMGEGKFASMCLDVVRTITIE
jgi:hypothetical protein